MADVLLLEVATPERLVARERVREAQIPCRNGYIGVLPGHAALLSELGEGRLSYTGEQGARAFRVAGGWVEVLEDHIRVLADQAEEAEASP
jgi:F-type H+-transporting ATPase subunit epsilon